MEDGRRHYQHRASVWMGYGVAGVFAWMAAGGFITYADSGLPELALPVSVLTIGVLFALGTRRQGVSTSPDGMTVSYSITTRRIPWCEIVRIEPRRDVPESRWFPYPVFAAVADLKSGETVRLPLPGRATALIEDLQADLAARAKTS